VNVQPPRPDASAPAFGTDGENAQLYQSSRLVRDYAGRELKPVEEVVLARLRPDLREKDVLELGCGAGAITRALLDAEADVVGVDISPAMIEYCRSTLPGGAFEVGELRDLSGHRDAAYDVVVAGANVLDVLSHEERPGVLAEIRRIVVDGGLFYFSTHNRRSAAAQDQAHHGPRLRREGSVHLQLRALAGFVVGARNHRRLARYQRYESDFAILNDPAHRWGLLHHYITRDAEQQELHSVGFELVYVWAEDGRLLGPGDEDSGSQELHYLARAAP